MLAGTRKIRLTQRASIHLDMARGLAAFAVLISHVRGFFFVPYHELNHHSMVISAIYAATSLGHQAVIVFFVLSGFFIVTTVVGSFRNRTWSWTVYLVNRIVRLSLVLIPALFLCLLLDSIGMALPFTVAFYRHPVESVISSSVASLETFRNFIGSFFYVQGILAQPFGSDGPLWSLSYEFWYYILFPVVACMLTRKLRLRARIGYCAAAVSILFFIGPTIAVYFAIWLIGGVIAMMMLSGSTQYRPGWASAAAIVPLACVLSVSIARPLDSGFLMDSVVAAGFAICMYSLLEMPEKPIGTFYATFARHLAGFSYTLYLTHFPILFFIRASIHQPMWRPDFLHLLYAAFIAAAAIVVAWSIAQVTEAKTSFVRRKILGLFP